MSNNSWPLIEKALELGCISYVDFAFAEMLLQHIPQATEQTAAFLCHLYRLSREGHLCAAVEGDTIFPAPHELWFSEVEEDPDIRCMLDQLAHAAKDLPEALICDVSDCSIHFPVAPICRFDNLYYFQKHWLFETSFCEHFHRLLASKPSLHVDEDRFHDQIQQMETRDLLNPQQAHAIKHAFQNCLSIICGGPGTGKTYTAGHLIRILWESMDPSEQQKCEIILAAPTGKATNNLQKSFIKAAEKTEGLEHLQAKTLHSLLGIHRSQRSLNMITADFIIVDESSMIDARVMSQLLASIKPGARLILLGDPYQLPPVESGSFFTDMIATLQDGNRASPHVFELKTCLRAELQEMIDFATHINHGDIQATLDVLKRRGPPVQRLLQEFSEDHWKTTQNTIIEHAVSLFPSPKMSLKDPERLLEAYQHFRILSPLRKRAFGVETINQQMKNRMISQVQYGEPFTAPIMILNNDYKMELFNGECGVLVQSRKRNEAFEKGDYAIFSDQTGKYRKIPAVLLPKFEYAYCLSIHKSQGSEFNDILLLMPEGSDIFGKEVLYTAVTRAKKQLSIWGSDVTLTQALQKQSHRYSGIAKRWQGMGGLTCNLNENEDIVRKKSKR